MKKIIILLIVLVLIGCKSESIKEELTKEDIESGVNFENATLGGELTIEGSTYINGNYGLMNWSMNGSIFWNYQLYAEELGRVSQNENNTWFIEVSRSCLRINCKDNDMSFCFKCMQKVEETNLSEDFMTFNDKSFSKGDLIIQSRGNTPRKWR